MLTKSPSCIAKEIIKIEKEALDHISTNISEEFNKCCDELLACQGKIIILGMGKSGHIGKKISATLASTGSPSFFIHPGEACHGDMGMIEAKDVVIAISYSGETPEMLAAIPAIQDIGTPLIAITGQTRSSLAKAARFTLCIQVPKEACPFNLAPTSSTTATLALGDALAVALLNMRNFSPSDFAKRHPGGSLGRQLLLKVADLMHTDEALPIVRIGTPLQQALIEMTAKRLGMIVIMNDQNQLCGIYTDGDLRRTVNAGMDIYATKIEDVMTESPLTTTPHTLASSALKMMHQAKITSLVVVSVSDGHVEGIIHIHDLLQAGLRINQE